MVVTPQMVFGCRLTNLLRRFNVAALSWTSNKDAAATKSQVYMTNLCITRLNNFSCKKQVLVPSALTRQNIPRWETVLDFWFLLNISKV